MKRDKYDMILDVWLCVITAIASLYCLLLILVITSNEANAQSTAGREIANIQSWLNEGSQGFYKPGTGDQWVRNSANGDRFVKVESTIDYKASNGRNYPVVIEKTAQIDGTKIGKAVVRMAKFIPPLAIGFEVYDLICELSDICKKDGSDEWEIPGESIPSENSIWDCSGFGNMTVTECLENIQGCNQGSVICDNPRLSSDAKSYLWDKKYTNGTFIGVITMSRQTPYELAQPRSPSETDWTNAEPLLNDERFDEPLLVNGQPVPLANLPILGNVPPITISDTETINRDSQGNITGTTRTTTTLEITDSATTERPGSVTGTETTTKTDYNTSGQPTGTQTTNSTPPPPEKPTSLQIEFDSVPPSNLETEEVSMTLPTAQSWGEGVCPADLSFTYVGQTHFIRWEPVCNTAEQLRPIVILFASISAMFIVAGVTKTVTA